MLKDWRAPKAVDLQDVAQNFVHDEPSDDELRVKDKAVHRAPRILQPVALQNNMSATVAVISLGVLLGT